MDEVKSRDINESLNSKISLDKFFEIANSKQYPIFRTNQYDLNVWLVRSNNSTSGFFDDIEVVFYKKGSEWCMERYQITTDPSDLSLISSKNPRGVAIVKPGHYPGLWTYGLHKGKYEALVQSQTVTVIRDMDRDSILDMVPPKESEYKQLYRYRVPSTGAICIDYLADDDSVIYREETGVFGINNHRASEWSFIPKIGPYSEGCAVHRDPTAYKNSFIPLIKVSSYWKNRFSGTYITEQDLLI